MSTPSTRKGRRKLWLLAAAIGAFGVFLSIGAGNAFAFSCTTDAGNNVIVSMNNETVTLSKGNLSQILANGSPCGATASSAASIVVFGNGTGDSLIVDEGGGRFEPGAGAAEIGLNEVEIWIAGIEVLGVNGNAAPDTINVGEGGPIGVSDALPALTTPPLGFAAGVLPAPATGPGIVNLNGDDDADILVAQTTAIVATDPVILVAGRGGNDTLSGKGGNGTGPSENDGTFFSGGEGDDSIQGGDGDDVLSGGPGNDVLDGDDNSTPGRSICFVQGVNIATGQVDLLHSNSSGDWVDYSGATGPITIDLDPSEGHPGSATGEGTDVIQNIENINGSPAGDTISGDNADNAIFGNGGDDKIAGDAGNDCEFGGDGNDTFDENEGTSLAQGGSGTDNGADEMFGNAGADDTIDYSSRSTRVNVFLEALPDTTEECFGGFGRQTLGGDFTAPDGADLDGDGFSGDDEHDCVYLDTENAIGGSNNDILDAAFLNNRSDNEFTGNGGNDKEVGGAGNDIFHEGSAASGADVMDGGTGFDTCDYSARSNALDVSLDGADNDGEAGEGDNCGGVFGLTFGFEGEEPASAPQNVEGVQGGSGADVINGNDNQNVLNGNAGNDTITGLGGQDVLNGGDGDDVLSGGTGNDAISGGNGTDTVDFASAGAGGVGVNVNLTTGQASGDGNDTLSGLENASGSSFNDSIRGDAGNNVLNGRGGADAIQGADGDDTVNGGAGDDELGGGAGNDRVNGQTGADAIRGGAGDDNLAGGPGADTLIGGVGNDVLSGGAGKDTMRGGPGTDRCNPGAPGLANGDTAAGCES